MTVHPPGPIRPATRVTARRWRSPRLILGVALVLGSALAGGLLVRRVAATGTYWSLRHDVRAGERVTMADLVVTHARLSDKSEQSLLIATVRPDPSAVWAVDVKAGSLVLRSAMTSERRSQELPIAVPRGAAPDDLAVGDVIDVWAGPSQPDEVARASTRVLTAVRVVAVGAAGGDSRTVVVAIGTEPPDGRVVTAVGVGRVTVVRAA